MWVVSGFPARHEASLPLVRFVPFMFLSQPQMKKYRCLWGMSIPNHNILCLSAIPGCQSQKPNVCPVESRNRMVRRGIRPLTCPGTYQGLTCPHVLSRKKTELNTPAASQPQAYAPIRPQTRPQRSGNRGLICADVDNHPVPSPFPRTVILTTAGGRIHGCF